MSIHFLATDSQRTKKFQHLKVVSIIEYSYCFLFYFFCLLNIKIKVLKKVLKILILHFLTLNENSMCGCVCANEKQGDRFEEKVYISK